MSEKIADVIKETENNKAGAEYVIRADYYKMQHKKGKQEKICQRK